MRETGKWGMIYSVYCHNVDPVFTDLINPGVMEMSALVPRSAAAPVERCVLEGAPAGGLWRDTAEMN